MENKTMYIIVCGNIYQSGRVEVVSVCNSLEDARVVLKEIEKLNGKDEYGEPDTVAYSKECCYYLIQRPLNQLPQYMKN